MASATRLSKGFPARFNPGMSHHGQRFLLVISLLTCISAQSSPCLHLILTNSTLTQIYSSNFFAGQSQPQNTSCSWIIRSPEGRVKFPYLLSFRVFDDSSNELILKSDGRPITTGYVHQRALLIPSSNLEIHYRPKPTTSPSTSSNIHRFLIELIHVHEHPDYFRCTTSGLLLPREWICNCISECLDGDFSDEENCPLCTMIKSSDNLLCRSDEIWCLPSTTPANPIDPNGVCTSRKQHPECSYSTTGFQCESILVRNEERGELVLDSSILSDRSSLCFVIIAQQRHKIQLFINHHHQTVHQPSDIDLLIYDGTDPQGQLFQSPFWLPIKYIVQTRDHHLATVVIRRRSPVTNVSFQYEPVDVVHHFLLNITWLSSVCSDEQSLCSGHFERKCYSHQQRCDGIWDCVHGDDELGCAAQSCPTTFACNDPIPTSSDRPRCYTWSERCNGDPFCANRSDERFCSHWWCNPDNGTFLCKNLNCIYEVWMCDGTDDCGDNSDEDHCPYHIPRRTITAAIIGATVCSILFVIALGCTCKLFHLRLVERQASMHLVDPRSSIEGHRTDRHRYHRSFALDNPLASSVEGQRIAPPSYNQTMGLVDEHDDSNALIVDNQPLPVLPTGYSHVRSSRRRQRHHSSDSRINLLEPSVSNSHFSRFRSQWRSLFTNHRSTSQPNESEHSTSVPSILLSTRSRPDECRELPPPYPPTSLASTGNDNHSNPSVGLPTTTSCIRPIPKRQIPSSSAIATTEENEQASTDDDENKSAIH